MKLLYLTGFIFEMTAAVDTAKYQDLSFAEVKEHIASGDLVPWLQRRLGDDVDLTLLRPDDCAIINQRLAEILEARGGQERRKWGVERSGLCLLIAWAAEIIQQTAGKVEIDAQ